MRGPDGSSDAAVVVPRWSAPPGIRACTTTRRGGFSSGPFESLNLSRGVGDDAPTVERNRAAIAAALDLPATPSWCHQVHGTRVVDASLVQAPVEADAMVARGPGPVCVIQTADCVPVVLAAADGGAVGVAHAGWRGLADGVIEATAAALGAPERRLVAWLGPGIGAGVYEVGDEVRSAFCAPDPGADTAFVPSPAGRWLADLYALARRRLSGAGVSEVHGGDRCTYSEPLAFFSYRRDGARSGRMATFAWIAPRA